MLILFMLSLIDPLVYIVYAYDAKETALRERNVHMGPSLSLKQRATLYRDGEWVCAVVHVMCSPLLRHNTMTFSSGVPLILSLLFSATAVPQTLPVSVATAVY